MSIFNMIAQGSGGGGGNIGEPLNLTVTTSGLDATITWEDNEIGTIPPTTFQKSELVRKIGSAPTSPSDGILVVTETVKDTYKTTGYVDQGLTDGETYYYRVFSYSDLGGISYCDAVNVTPSAGGWQPGANTIAYRPLNSTDTVNDMKGTGTAYNLTGTATFGVDEGVDCYQSRSYGTMLTIADSLLYGNSNFTVNYWILEKQTSSSHQHVFLSGGTSQRQQVLMWINGNNNHLMCGQYFQDYDTGYTLTAGNWINVCITYDGTAMKIYVNGSLQLTQNVSFGITSSGETSLGDSSLGGNDQYFRGNMSEAILEDKTRTLQEIQDYYDLTKANYGIS